MPSGSYVFVIIASLALKVYALDKIALDTAPAVQWQASVQGSLHTSLTLDPVGIAQGFANDGQGQFMVVLHA